VNTWIVLGATALILLAIYWNNRNAVWGGLTVGVIIGVPWKFIGGTDWHLIIRVATVGTLIGFGAELLVMLPDYLKKRSY